MKKSFIYTIGIISAVIIVFGGIAAYYGYTSVDTYPTLDATGISFQGKSVETEFGFLEFDAEDVISYQADENAVFKSSPKGVQYYFLEDEATVEDVINAIQPKEELKVLFAFYSPGEEDLNLEKDFYTYPKGPYVTTEITDSAAFEIPENRGFVIISNEDYGYDYNLLKDSTKSAGQFKIKLKDQETGWILYPLSGPGNLNNPRIEKAFVMDDAGRFVEVDDLSNAELGEYKFAWVKIKEKQQGQYEEEEEEETETVAKREDLNLSATTVRENRDLVNINISNIEALTSESSESTTGDDAYVKSVKYLSNIETSDALINTPSSEFPERYEGNFIEKSAMSDDTNTAYIMAAIEVEIGGTQGTVDINSIEYSTFSQRRNKIAFDWKSWKDGQTDGRCIGEIPLISILQYNDGVFSDMALAEDQNDNKIFSSNSEAFQGYLTRLGAGNKYVLVLSMQGMDECAKKFNWEAPVQVEARVRTDFVNIEFIVPNESSPVNWNGDANSNVTNNRIEGVDETRWVKFIDKSPYS